MNEKERSKRPQSRTDATFSGRSMVEMLGVLAIIGVLSVGAMSGYSKAMMKYKLNRQTEQIGSILDYATLYYDDLDKENFTSPSLVQFFQKIGAIPQEMVKPEHPGYIYDIFGNRINIYHAIEDTPIRPQYFGLIIYIDKNAVDICLNLFHMAKLRSSMLWVTQFGKSTEDGNAQGNRVYGDNYCTRTSSYCLKNLTLSQMHDLCSYCSDSTGTCSFVFLWNFKTGG